VARTSQPEANVTLVTQWSFYPGCFPLKLGKKVKQKGGAFCWYINVLHHATWNWKLGPFFLEGALEKVTPLKT